MEKKLLEKSGKFVSLKMWEPCKLQFVLIEAYCVIVQDGTSYCRFTQLIFKSCFVLKNSHPSAFVIYVFHVTESQNRHQLHVVIILWYSKTPFERVSPEWGNSCFRAYSH